MQYQKLKSSKTLIIEIFFLLAIFCIAVVSPASVKAQSMGNSTTYSDLWLYNSPTGEPKIALSGTTENPYNYYGHSHWVVVRLTSPTNTDTTNTSSPGGNYSRAETTQTLDFDAIYNATTNEFNIRSEHWMSCPYMGNSYPSTTTIEARTFILHAYRKIYPSGEYEPTCCSTCTISPLWDIAVNDPYTQCGSLYLYNNTFPCSPGVCDTGRTTPGRCRPDNGRTPPFCQ
jgi:hypothetical protein